MSPYLNITRTAVEELVYQTEYYTFFVFFVNVGKFLYYERVLSQKKCGYA